MTTNQQNKNIMGFCNEHSPRCAIYSNDDGAVYGCPDYEKPNQQKISKNPMRKRAYKPQLKTIKKFTSTFRKECCTTGLSHDAYDQAASWDEMEIVLGKMLLDFIKKSPIV